MDTLAFPDERPSEYKLLEEEAVFDADKHLALGTPERIIDLAELGYSPSEISNSPSSFGVSTAFRILSDEGVQIMHALCTQIYSNRNKGSGTGKNRLGSYVRGAGYRSKFIRDFCDSPVLAAHLSKITGVPLARHSVPAVACGINYAPDDITKAIDNWHVDSVAFDIVMMVSDPTILVGGEFETFLGTKQEGRELLGISGEEGQDADLPQDRVMNMAFPAAGYGFIQQGNLIFHRACRLREASERITMIPSFVVTPSTADDATKSVNMAGWEDPGIVPELARHEAWRASARLQKLVGDISLSNDNNSLVSEIDKSISSLIAFRDRIAEDEE